MPDLGLRAHSKLAQYTFTLTGAEPYPTNNCLPLTRDNVRMGLSFAFDIMGVPHLMEDETATNAFIDYMADVVGFLIPSDHRSDLTPSDRLFVPEWNYWGEEAREGSPTPDEISDALDAAFVSVGLDNPLASAGIAFMRGFEYCSLL